MPVKVVCDVCQEELDIAEFLFRSCGHGFCTACSEGMLKARKTECAICRRHQGIAKPLRIFVHAEESDATPQEKAASVDNFVNMFTNDPPTTLNVDQFRKKVEFAARDPRLDHNTVNHLLRSVHVVGERLEPLYWQLRQEQDEKHALMQRMQDLERVHLRTAELETEVAAAKDLLLVATNKNTTMESEVEWFRTMVGQERIEKMKTRKMMDRFEEEAKAAKKENEKLKKDLEEKDREVTLLKKKLRALTKAQARHKPDIQTHATESADDSLVVEPPVTGPAGPSS